MTGIRRVSQLGTSGEPIDNLGDVAISTTVTYGIGSTGPAGGTIFITPSTAGNTTGKWFELVPASHTYIAREWSEPAYESTSVTGADGTAIGTGYQNTLDIIAQGNSNPSLSAAKYCDSLTIGGFSDWFLPSKDELTEIYTNLTPADGMYADYNWSSTEYNSIGARYRHLGNGEESFAPKLYTLYVSPVRMFDMAETITTPTAVEGDALQYNGTEWVNRSIVAAPTNAGVLKGLTGDFISAINASGGGFQFTLTSTGPTTYLFTVYSTTLSLVFGPSFSTNFIAGKILDIYILGMMGNASIYGATITSVSSTTISLSNPTSIPTLATSPTESMFGQLTIPEESVYGFGNTFLGNNAGAGLTEVSSYSQSTSQNVAIGQNAMAEGTYSPGYQTYNNVAIGSGAGNNFIGNNNTFIGFQSGNDIINTNVQKQISNSCFIGTRAGSSMNFSSSISDLILIGTNNSGYGITEGSQIVLGLSGTTSIAAKLNGSVETPNQGYIHYRLGSNISYNNASQNVTIPFNISVASTGYIPYSTSTGKITAQYGGIYEVNCGVYASADISQLWGVLNGARVQSFVLSPTTNANMAGSAIFKLAAGDTLGIAAWGNGTAITINENNFHTYLKIRYLG